MKFLKFLRAFWAAALSCMFLMVAAGCCFGAAVLIGDREYLAAVGLYLAAPGAVVLSYFAFHGRSV
jgi:hypothetical protein